MRYESTFQSFYRTTTQPTELAGVRIGAEQKIWVGIASANRDPRRWPDPTRFDLTRPASGNLAFGTGIHGCVGKMIARLEVEIVLTTMAERVAELVPAGPPTGHAHTTHPG